MLCSKKCAYIIIMLLAVVAVTAASAQVNKESAAAVVMNQIVKQKKNSVDVYLSKSVVSRKERLTAADSREIAVPFASCWVAFIDDRPFANWYHDCRYVLIDEKTGQYETIKETIYPEHFPDAYEPVSLMPRREPVETDITTTTTRTLSPSPASDHLHAVVICGESGDVIIDRERHWRDISVIYCTLLEKGYTKENVIVHSSNASMGVDLDGASPSDDIDYNSQKAAINSTFSNLESNLDPGDQLFVYVTGHGSGSGGESKICLPGSGNYVYDYELASWVENIDCAQMIYLFQQCMSGGFVDDLITTVAACINRSVHTACGSN